MRVGRRVVFLFGILPLAACAVVGPVTDAGMEDAPYEACARFAGARVSVSEGQVRLSSACFKSYTRYRIPRAHNEAEADDHHGAH